MSGITVTVLDTEDDSTETIGAEQDGYVLVTVGKRYLDGIQTFKNGTIILTLKLDKETT